MGNHSWGQAEEGDKLYAATNLGWDDPEPGLVALPARVWHLPGRVRRGPRADAHRRPLGAAASGRGAGRGVGRGLEQRPKEHAGFGRDFGVRTEFPSDDYSATAAHAGHADHSRRRRPPEADRQPGRDAHDGRRRESRQSAARHPEAAPVGLGNAVAVSAPGQPARRQRRRHGYRETPVRHAHVPAGCEERAARPDVSQRPRNQTARREHDGFRATGRVQEGFPAT